MELIKIINKKSIAAILSIIAVLTFSTNSFAIKIYTSKLSEGDQLKFTGTAWKVFKTKKIAKSVANGEKPKAKSRLYVCSFSAIKNKTLNKNSGRKSTTIF